MNSSIESNRKWKRRHHSKWYHYAQHFEDNHRDKYEKRYDKKDKYYYDRHHVKDRYSDLTKTQGKHLKEMQNKLQQTIEYGKIHTNHFEDDNNSYNTKPSGRPDNLYYTQHHVEDENTKESVYGNGKWLESEDVSQNTTEQQDNSTPEEEFSINFVVTPEDILGSDSLPTLESNIKLEPLDDFDSQNTENSNTKIDIQQIKCEPLTIPCQENKSNSSYNEQIRNINYNKRAFVHLILQARIDNLHGLNKDLAEIAAKIIDSQDEVIIKLLHENNSLKNAEL